MSNELFNLYQYLLENKNLKDEIISFSQDEFLKKETLLLAGLGLIKEIIEKMSRLDKIMLFNKELRNKCSQAFLINEYLINSYGEINGYLIYDFLSLEYEIILNKIKEILAI